MNRPQSRLNGGPLQPTRLVTVDLRQGARYMTPLGRVVRLLSVTHSVPGQAPEATFAYETASAASGPAELGERMTLTVRQAQHVLRRLG